MWRHVAGAVRVVHFEQAAELLKVVHSAPALGMADDPAALIHPSVSLGYVQHHTVDVLALRIAECKLARVDPLD